MTRASEAAPHTKEKATEQGQWYAFRPSPPQVLKGCSEAERQRTYAEAAALSAVRFDYRDRSEPADLAKSLAYQLHYFEPSDVLRGPAVMWVSVDSACVQKL